MSEIKPIDWDILNNAWDSLPKIWAWDDGCLNDAVFGVYLKKDPTHYQILKANFETEWFMFISETDPRIKTPKMRVMTTEELNDIYWEFGKYFRVKYINGAIGCTLIFDLGTDLSNMEYSNDSGKTWNKCEVAE